MTNKTKVTRKYLRDTYPCIAIPYAEARLLLYFNKPHDYTTGIYGWNFDAYLITFKGRILCITTGCRQTINHFNKGTSYDLCREYGERAKEIIEDKNLPVEIQQLRISKLLEMYLDEVIEKEKEECPSIIKHPLTSSPFTT